MTAWRTLNEAKGLIANGKMKQAEEALDNAHELGLTTDQQALYQQLQSKLPRSRAAASTTAAQCSTPVVATAATSCTC